MWKETFASDTTLVGVVKELRRVLDDRSHDRPTIRTADRVLRDGDLISVGTTPLLYRNAAAVGSTETVGPPARYVSWFGCR